MSLIYDKLKMQKLLSYEPTLKLIYDIMVERNPHENDGKILKVLFNSEVLQNDVLKQIYSELDLIP